MIKDLTSTTFGLVIAYVIPGVFGLYALSPYMDEIKKMFDKFIEAKSDIGLFFLFIFLSTAVGLVVTIIKWVLYERLITNKKIPNNFFATIGTSENKLTAFRATVDEHYRYHQFWGNLSIILPILAYNYLTLNSEGITTINLLVVIFILIFIEFLLVIAAVEAYNNYLKRSTAILNIS